MSSVLQNGCSVFPFQYPGPFHIQVRRALIKGLRIPVPLERIRQEPAACLFFIFSPPLPSQAGEAEKECARREHGGPASARV